jgi:hypothetical protein
MGRVCHQAYVIDPTQQKVSKQQRHHSLLYEKHLVRQELFTTIRVLGESERKEGKKKLDVKNHVQQLWLRYTDLGFEYISVQG